MNYRIHVPKPTANISDIRKIYHDVADAEISRKNRTASE